jgi:hypothetical protein
MSDPHFYGILRLDENSVVVSRTFGFIDSHKVNWAAPQGSMTDGASIPGIAKLVIGGSFQEPYLRAAVLHDIYCKSRVRSWQNTAKMFYEAMITAGTNIIKAQAMYWAVYLGGPHWEYPNDISGNS